MEQNGIGRNYMEFVFSPQGLAVDISNGILKSDNDGFLYCSKIETNDISNNSITSNKLDSNISLSGLNVTVITGSSIYSDTISCNNLYVQNGQLTQQGTQGETGLQGPTGLQGENGPQGETGLQGARGLQGIDITGEFVFGQNITASNIYAASIITNTDSFVNSIRMGQGTVTGAQNTALGINALDSAIGSAENNTALGNSSLTNNTSGFNNTSIGYNALLNNTSGYRNIAVGGNAQMSNTSGLNNAALGFSSLYTNQTGSNNTAIGYNSLYNTTRHQNVGIGSLSLQYNTIGIGNVAIGYNSGGTIGNTSSTNCTFIGTSSNSGNANYTNSTAIGANAVITASNQIVLGNSSVTRITTTGAFSAPSVKSGTLLYTTQTTMNLTTTSPRNVLITDYSGTTTSSVYLPNSPVNGTCFIITNYVATLSIYAAGTNRILRMPPSFIGSGRNPVNSDAYSSVSISNNGGYITLTFKFIYYNGIWYLIKRSVN